MRFNKPILFHLPGMLLTGLLLFQNNAKSKVLVRSHAMREETSPPREPSPTSNISPRIKLTPSPASSPVSGKPVLVLSPSISRGNSPCRSPLCTSPTSTLVPSPASRCSPQCISPQNPTENSDTANLQVRPTDKKKNTACLVFKSF